MYEDDSLPGQERACVCAHGFMEESYQQRATIDYLSIQPLRIAGYKREDW